jgi:hypothetical protein
MEWLWRNKQTLETGLDLRLRFYKQSFEGRNISCNMSWSVLFHAARRGTPRAITMLSTRWKCVFVTAGSLLPYLQIAVRTNISSLPSCLATSSPIYLRASCSGTNICWSRRDPTWLRRSCRLIKATWCSRNMHVGSERQSIDFSLSPQYAEFWSY